MSTNKGTQQEGGYFEQQRALLINDVAAARIAANLTICLRRTNHRVQSLENVLQNINKLNRSLEGVIAVSSYPKN